jgi:hypothetical protein
MDEGAYSLLITYGLGLLFTIIVLMVHFKRKHEFNESSKKRIMCLYLFMILVYIDRLVQHSTALFIHSSFSSEVSIHDLIRIYIQDLGYVFYFEMILILTLTWFDLYAKIKSF